MAKKSLIVFLMISLVLLSGIILKQRADEKKNEPLRILETECGNLKLQVKKLEQEQKRVKKEYEKKLISKGTVELVFLELDKNLSKKALPLMQYYGLTGVIALAENEVPGEEDTISWNQYKELLNKGWEKCLICENADKLKSWYKGISSKLNGLGVDLSEVVVFVNGDYSSDKDSTLADYGFQVAVNAGGLDNDKEVQDDSQMIWKPDTTIGARELQQSDLDKLAESGGNLSIFINFDKTDEKNGFIEEEFRDLLDLISDYVTAEKIVVSTFSDNKEYRDDFIQSAEKERKAMEEELQIYQEQIDELMGKIRDTEKKIEETRYK